VNRLPVGHDVASSLLFVELCDFERLPSGWILDHLDQWDQPGRGLDAGGLGNQTSPLYMALRQ
jgi:hypothetical protein